MARLRDIPHVYRTVGPWTFLKRIYHQTYADDLLVWAAALAFSWLFALFPFLIFCLSLVPLLPDTVKPTEADILAYIDDVLVTGESVGDAAGGLVEEVAEGNTAAEDPLGQDGEMDAQEQAGVAEDAADRPTGGIDEVDGEAANAEAGDPETQDETADDEPPPERRPAVISQTVTALVSDLIHRPPATLLTISIIVALFTASGGVAMTMAGLDKCYDVAPEKIRPVYMSRPIAMLLTVVLAVLIVLTVILLPVGGAVIGFITRQEAFGIDLGWLGFTTRLLRWGLGMLLLLSALAITYKFGPSVKTRLHLFSPGSLFVVACWVLTAIGFQFYIESLGAADTYARTYGAVAGVAFLMLLFYLDAFFLLVGAEINAEVDFIRLGIRSGPLPEDREVAPVPTYQLDEEDRELKAELEDRRSVDEAAEAEKLTK